MTILAPERVCPKCRTRLVLTSDSTCIICGFAVQPPQLAPAKVMAPPPPAALPMRTVPSAASIDPGLRDKIINSYQSYGLVQTAEDFSIKPSTLVLRLKRWGVALHGRGWKPSHGKENGASVSANGNGVVHTNGVHAAALFATLKHIDQLEKAVLEMVKESGQPKDHQAGRVELLQSVRVMLGRDGSHQAQVTTR
ncbi:MAG: hypothetical protein HY261_08735 [Chloroflexi bacterium]|nr:hypothetical protein [Chloroflexota bacterium]